MLGFSEYKEKIFRMIVKKTIHSRFSFEIGKVRAKKFSHYAKSSCKETHRADLKHDFAKNKIISFVKPDSGIPFMTVTWGGMIGAASAMNVNGLTVTLNAGKSDMPLIAKTPISLLAREIIQYASTIKEAIAIAEKSSVFVSESIMIGSAVDNKAVLIEISPKNFGVYDVANTNQLICSNHFQSDAYSDDENNSKHILESHSK